MFSNWYSPEQLTPHSEISHNILNKIHETLYNNNIDLFQQIEALYASYNKVVSEINSGFTELTVTACVLDGCPPSCFAKNNHIHDERYLNKTPVNESAENSVELVTLFKVTLPEEVGEGSYTGECILSEEEAITFSESYSNIKSRYNKDSFALVGHTHSDYYKRCESVSSVYRLKGYSPLAASFCGDPWVTGLPGYDTRQTYFTANDFSIKNHTHAGYLLRGDTATSAMFIVESPRIIECDPGDTPSRHDVPMRNTILGLTARDFSKNNHIHSYYSIEEARSFGVQIPKIPIFTVEITCSEGSSFTTETKGSTIKESVQTELTKIKARGEYCSYRIIKIEDIDGNTLPWPKKPNAAKNPYLIYGTEEPASFQNFSYIQRQSVDPNYEGSGVCIDSSENLIQITPDGVTETSYTLVQQLKPDRLSGICIAKSLADNQGPPEYCGNEYELPINAQKVFVVDSGGVEQEFYDDNQRVFILQENNDLLEVQYYFQYGLHPKQGKPNEWLVASNIKDVHLFTGLSSSFNRVYPAAINTSDQYVDSNQIADNVNSYLPNERIATSTFSWKVLRVYEDGYVGIDTSGNLYSTSRTLSGLELTVVSPWVTPIDTGVKNVITNRYVTTVLKEDGTVYAFGSSNSYGTLSPGSSAECDSVTLEQAKAAPLHTSVTQIYGPNTPNGSIYAKHTDNSWSYWGTTSTYGDFIGGTQPDIQVAPPLSSANIVDLAVGAGFAIALTSSGDVYKWGSDAVQQITDGYVHKHSNVKAISASSSSYCTVKTDGSVACYGHNYKHRLCPDYTETGYSGGRTQSYKTDDTSIALKKWWAEPKTPGKSNAVFVVTCSDSNPGGWYNEPGVEYIYTDNTGYLADEISDPFLGIRIVPRLKEGCTLTLVVGSTPDTTKRYTVPSCEEYIPGTSQEPSYNYAIENLSPGKAATYFSAEVFDVYGDSIEQVGSVTDSAGYVSQIFITRLKSILENNSDYSSVILSLTASCSYEYEVLECPNIPGNLGGTCSSSSGCLSTSILTPDESGIIDITQLPALNGCPITIDGDLIPDCSNMPTEEYPPQLCYIATEEGGNPLGIKQTEPASSAGTSWEITCRTTSDTFLVNSNRDFSRGDLDSILDLLETDGPCSINEVPIPHCSGTEVGSPEFCYVKALSGGTQSVEQVESGQYGFMEVSLVCEDGTTLSYTTNSGGELSSNHLIDISSHFQVSACTLNGLELPECSDSSLYPNPKICETETIYGKPTLKIKSTGTESAASIYFECSSYPSMEITTTSTGSISQTDLDRMTERYVKAGSEGKLCTFDGEPISLCWEGGATSIEVPPIIDSHLKWELGDPEAYLEPGGLPWYLPRSVSAITGARTTEDYFTSGSYKTGSEEEQDCYCQVPQLQVNRSYRIDQEFPVSYDSDCSYTLTYTKYRDSCLTMEDFTYEYNHVARELHFILNFAFASLMNPVFVSLVLKETDEIMVSREVRKQYVNFTIHTEDLPLPPWYLRLRFNQDSCEDIEIPIDIPCPPENIFSYGTRLPELPTLAFNLKPAGATPGEFNSYTGDPYYAIQKSPGGFNKAITVTCPSGTHTINTADDGVISLGDLRNLTPILNGGACTLSDGSISAQLVSESTFLGLMTDHQYFEIIASSSPIYPMPELQFNICDADVAGSCTPSRVIKYTETENRVFIIKAPYSEFSRWTATAIFPGRPECTSVVSPIVRGYYMCDTDNWACVLDNYSPGLAGNLTYDDCMEQCQPHVCDGRSGICKPLSEVPEEYRVGSLATYSECTCEPQDWYYCDTERGLCVFDKVAGNQTLAECESTCLVIPHYSCDINNYSCTIDASGIFTDLEYCEDCCNAVPSGCYMPETSWINPGEIVTATVGSPNSMCNIYCDLGGRTFYTDATGDLSQDARDYIADRMEISGQPCTLASCCLPCGEGSICETIDTCPIPVEPRCEFDATNYYAPALGRAIIVFDSGFDEGCTALYPEVVVEYKQATGEINPETYRTPYATMATETFKTKYLDTLDRGIVQYKWLTCYKCNWGEVYESFAYLKDPQGNLTPAITSSAFPGEAVSQLGSGNLIGRRKYSKNSAIRNVYLAVDPTTNTFLLYLDPRIECYALGIIEVEACDESDDCIAVTNFNLAQLTQSTKLHMRDAWNTTPYTIGTLPTGKPIIKIKFDRVPKAATYATNEEPLIDLTPVTFDTRGATTPVCVMFSTNDAHRPPDATRSLDFVTRQNDNKALPEYIENKTRNGMSCTFSYLSSDGKGNFCTPSLYGEYSTYNACLQDIQKPGSSVYLAGYSENFDYHMKIQASNYFTYTTDTQILHSPIGINYQRVAGSSNFYTTKKLEILQYHPLQTQTTYKFRLLGLSTAANPEPILDQFTLTTNVTGWFPKHTFTLSVPLSTPRIHMEVQAHHDNRWIYVTELHHSTANLSYSDTTERSNKSASDYIPVDPYSTSQASATFSRQYSTLTGPLTNTAIYPVYPEPAPPIEYKGDQVTITTPITSEGYLVLPTEKVYSIDSLEYSCPLVWISNTYVFSGYGECKCEDPKLSVEGTVLHQEVRISTPSIDSCTYLLTFKPVLSDFTKEAAITLPLEIESTGEFKNPEWGGTYYGIDLVELSYVCEIGGGVCPHLKQDTYTGRLIDVARSSFRLAGHPASDFALINHLHSNKIPFLEALHKYSLRGGPTLNTDRVGGYIIDVKDVHLNSREEKLIDLPDPLAVVASASLVGMPPPVLENNPYFGMTGVNFMISQQGSNHYKVNAGYASIVLHLLYITEKEENK